MCLEFVQNRAKGVDSYRSQMLGTYKSLTLIGCSVCQATPEDSSKKDHAKKLKQLTNRLVALETELASLESRWESGIPHITSSYESCMPWIAPISPL